MLLTFVFIVSLPLSFASSPFFSLRVPGRKSAGTCNVKSPPISWLTTRGRGILTWATAGVPPNGPHFCLGGSSVTHTVEVDYHVNLTNVATAKVYKQKKGPPTVKDETYDCGTGNPSIRYCSSFCSYNATLEKLVIDAALVVHSPLFVSKAILANMGQPSDIAVTVIEVDLNADPEAHLVAEVFPDPSWCSVYIGIQTSTVGYVYEIQVAKVLT